MTVQNRVAAKSPERQVDVDQNRPQTSDTYTTPAVDWTMLVSRVQAGEAEGLDQLYRLFARGIRFHLCRQLGSQELDDKVHDTFLVVVQAIQKGDLREPDRLMGFVRTIVRRQVATYIAERIATRREQMDLNFGSRLKDVKTDLERTAISSESRVLIRAVLERMSARDREILTRFYLFEQPQEAICEAMALTETQFRLLKSRAKARFGDLGRKKVVQSTLSALFVRTSVNVSHL